jgi:hypothetical protein
VGLRGPKPRPRGECIMMGSTKWKLEKQLPQVGEMWNSYERVVEVQTIPQVCVVTEFVDNPGVNVAKYKFL